MGGLPSSTCGAEQVGEGDESGSASGIKLTKMSHSAASNTMYMQQSSRNQDLPGLYWVTELSQSHENGGTSAAIEYSDLAITLRIGWIRPPTRGFPARSLGNQGGLNFPFISVQLVNYHGLLLLFHSTPGTRVPQVQNLLK